MKEEWLFPGAMVPVDMETTAALVAEIKRLIDVVGGMALEQHMTERYFADGKEFLYPHAGDPSPPKDTKVLLLTRGGVCVTGYWGQHWCLGWLPLPKRNKEKEDMK